MIRIARCFAALVAVLPGAALAQPAPASIPVTVVTGGLDSQALGIAHPGDGSPRLVVIHKGAIDNGEAQARARVVRDGVLQATPYFTIRNGSFQCRETVGGPLQQTGFTIQSEQGLLGLAFHPQFASNGHLYVSFSGANGDSIVARITAADPAADALTSLDLATCLVLLRVDQDFANHDGGHLLFDPDGYLTFGLGDGGSGDDPCNRAQTLDPDQLLGNPAGGSGTCDADAAFLAIGGNPDSRALQGKLVRIDVDTTTPAGANGLCASRADGSANYGIPSDNPFLAANPACDETYAYGLRNPWRYSFDRVTGDLLLGDVGQDHWEEVDLVARAGLPGRNFDWKVCEGHHVRNSCTNVCAPSDSEVIIEYHNNGNGCSGPTGLAAGCSVTGGYRYRGPDVALQGVYFFGDACSSRLWYSVESSPGSWTIPTAQTQVTGLAGSILGFGEGPGGVVYFVAGSSLYRIGGDDVLFSDGFE